MLFNSFLFLIFFLIVYLLYHNTSEKFRKPILFVSSIVFYGSWDFITFDSLIPKFLIHFMTVITVNFHFLKWMERCATQAEKKIPLTIAVILNVLNIAFFKYFYFLAEILGIFIGEPELKLKAMEKISIILPIAISFYTFQIIAYLVDYYRGTIENKTSYLDFSIFILFFPQQLAGPILRAKEFMPQLNSKRTLSDEQIVEGIGLVGFGLLKKVVLADSIARLLDPVFANPSAYSGKAIVCALVGFFFQLWGDFSGYSDIARGCGKLLGFELPKNFIGPIFAQSFREMWTRWHITLSSFLRDYVYFPLGGSKGTSLRTDINNFITMFVAGVWHGANWNYVIWGIIIGFSLMFERNVLSRSKFWSESKSKPAIVVRFFTISIFWFLIADIFRVTKLSDLGLMIQRSFLWSAGEKILYEEFGYLCILFFILHAIEYKPEYITTRVKRPVTAIVVSSILFLFMMTALSNRQVQFFYFQF
jgi:alginate O-acetyltransferase complex protein AlgI